MTEASPDRIAVEFSTAEAKLIIAALRQFEPFWPSDMDDMSRAELLADIHRGVQRVIEALDAAEVWLDDPLWLAATP
jgi:hypothetical protein